MGVWKMATVALGIGCALGLYALRRWKTRQAQEEEDVAHTVKPDDSSPPPIPPRTKTYADAVKQTKEEKIQEDIEEQKEETKKTTPTPTDYEV